MKPSEREQREIDTFRRFLALGYKPDEWRQMLSALPGWAPYTLGFGPAPPASFDDVPCTAWSFPA